MDRFECSDLVCCGATLDDRALSLAWGNLRLSVGSQDSTGSDSIGFNQGFIEVTADGRLPQSRWRDRVVGVRRSGKPTGWAARWLAVLLGASSAACTSLGFVTQAAMGQLELTNAARPIPEVIDDPETSDSTRQLLGEIGYIKWFAGQNGLAVSGNYEEYVELEREYPVWFVNASEPLAFEPVLFSFPIVGSFPGLAWFDERDAAEFAGELEREGYDVNVRGVHAFSTGGWFDDPVVWSMLFERETALPILVNTVLHESVHATLLIKDQQYFNESLASFIADRLTPQYLVRRFGAHAEELAMYQELQQRRFQYGVRLKRAYDELAALYVSQSTDEEKLERKRAITDDLQSELELEHRPNNASLIGFQLYRVGEPEFERLLAACRGNWRRFLSAVASLDGDDFGREQNPEFGGVIEARRARGCPRTLFTPEAPRSYPKPLRRGERRRRVLASEGRL